MKTIIMVILSFANIIAQAQINLLPDTGTISRLTVHDEKQISLFKADSTSHGIKQQNGNQKSYQQFIVPTVLVGYGIVAQFNPSLIKLDDHLHRNINLHVHRRITLDDYLQYAPAVNVLALDLLGVKAKHSLGDRSLVMATSYLLTAAVVQTMKHTIGVQRPDGSNTKSFPSGHTATAFVGAHLLFKEYVNVNPWIGIGGYVVATATGALRMVNKKHWFSDVMAGAGIGIISAEIAYLLLPTIHQAFGGKEKGKPLVILPSIAKGQYGLSLSYKW